MLQWMGLEHEATPKPPRKPLGFKFFKRGWLAGLCVGTPLGFLLAAVLDGVR